MRARRRHRLPNFEACSLALFAALAMGSAGPVRAQVAPPSRASTAITAAGAPLARATAVVDIPANAGTRQQIADAFREADTDGDGRISRSEARIWTGFARQFDLFDRDKDGVVSWAEFDESLK